MSAFSTLGRRLIRDSSFEARLRSPISRWNTSFSGPYAPQVLRAFTAPLVLCEAPRNVNSNTGVETAIAALDEVYAVRGDISHASLARLMPGYLASASGGRTGLVSKLPPQLGHCPW